MYKKMLLTKLASLHCSVALGLFLVSNVNPAPELRIIEVSVLLCFFLAFCLFYSFFALFVCLFFFLI